MEMNGMLWEEGIKSWRQMESFRNERQRNKRYTYGRQWEDKIEVDGVMMSEENYLRSQGSVPLKNNLIRRLVRNVLGVWRNDFRLPEVEAHDPEEKMMAGLVNKLLQANAQLNRLEELYARTMEEFLISGMAIHRKSYGLIQGRMDCRTDYVHPDNFFFSTEGSDFRGWDINLIGEIHHVSLQTAISCFGISRSEAEELAMIGNATPADRRTPIEIMEIWYQEAVCYSVTHDKENGRLRYIEDPEAGTENARREWKQVWKYAFMTRGGKIIRRGVSPYSHRGHPYVLKVYPYIDGEVHSFVADVIDQQRYTNRLITMYDWIMRSSAKGVLLFPESALPDEMELEDIADEWSRFNGVITYKAKNGIPGPEQVSSTGSHGGITDLLNIQLKMFEDISGVNSALQGKLESSSVSGALFNQQTRNALTSLKDLIAGYREFILEGTMKDACNILRFYTPEKIARIAGMSRSDIGKVNLSLFLSPDLDLEFK